MTTAKRLATYDLFYTGLALVVGLFAGWVDFHNDEPQAAAILLVLFGAVLGFAQPRRAWRWALLIALCIPAAYLIGSALGYQPVSWPKPGLYATLLALIPAFIGTYGGALLNKVAFSAGE